MLKIKNKLEIIFFYYSFIAKTKKRKREKQRKKKINKSQNLRLNPFLFNQISDKIHTAMNHKLELKSERQINDIFLCDSSEYVIFIIKLLFP